MDPELEHPLPHASVVAEAPEFDPVEPGLDSRSRLRLQSLEPVIEAIPLVSPDVLGDPDWHTCHCSQMATARQRSWGIGPRSGQTPLVTMARQPCHRRRLGWGLLCWVAPLSRTLTPLGAATAVGLAPHRAEADRPRGPALARSHSRPAVLLATVRSGLQFEGSVQTFARA